jgi:hypothetical protein
LVWLKLTSGNHCVPAPPPVEGGANARTVLAGKMAATRQSAGLGDSFLALRHAQAGPGQEHHSTLDRNTTAPKMPRYQSEGQESQYNIRFCVALACCAPFWRVEIAIGGRNTATGSVVTETSTSVCQATTNEMAKQSKGAPQACYKKWSLLS